MAHWSLLPVQETSVSTGKHTRHSRAAAFLIFFLHSAPLEEGPAVHEAPTASWIPIRQYVFLSQHTCKSVRLRLTFASLCRQGHAYRDTRGLGVKNVSLYYYTRVYVP